MGEGLGVNDGRELTESEWLRLLPGRAYRFAMGMRRGEGAGFFGRGPEAGAVLAERRRLVAEAWEEYVLEPEGVSVGLGEALGLMRGWTGLGLAGIREAAEEVETDWMVLERDELGMFRVRAGVVCFASGWSLREKAGQTVAEVHGPVPGLEAGLGKSIAVFLDRLGPGSVWCRDNWGLSADPGRDHHPRRAVARLEAGATLDGAWLRLEEQLFAGLGSGGVLFAIRVTSHRLDEVARVRGAAVGLAEALRTMSEEVAEYKGVAAARERLAVELVRVMAG